MAQDNMQNQPEWMAWGWIADNAVQAVVFPTASEAIIEMSKRIDPGNSDEASIIAKAENLGFRLALVGVTMRVIALLSPYP